MIFLQGFIKFDQGISEKCVGQTFDGRKKERKKERKKKNNNKKRSKHNMSPKLCLGNIIKWKCYFYYYTDCHVTFENWQIVVHLKGNKLVTHAQWGNG